MRGRRERGLLRRPILRRRRLRALHAPSASFRQLVHDSGRHPLSKQSRIRIEAAQDGAPAWHRTCMGLPARAEVWRASSCQCHCPHGTDRARERQAAAVYRRIAGRETPSTRAEAQLSRGRGADQRGHHGRLAGWQDRGRPDERWKAGAQPGRRPTWSTTRGCRRWISTRRPTKYAPTVPCSHASRPRCCRWHSATSSSEDGAERSRRRARPLSA